MALTHVPSPAAPLSRRLRVLRPTRIRVAAGIAGLLGLLLVAGVGTGWYFSEMFERDVLAVHHKSHEYPLRVVSVGGGAITINASARPDGDWAQPGVYGLEWTTGYGRLGAVLAATKSSVTREFTLVTGTAPKPGDAVRTDTFAYPDDPLTGLGLPFADVQIQAELGAFPAWRIDAPGDRWAILVHGGERAPRTDMLRDVGIYHAAGFTALVISYRNDLGAPADPAGRFQYGAEEWRELDAAVRYALEEGASDIVLVGHSMGGSVVMGFLYSGDHAARVRGVVLDSPLLDLERTVRWNARDVAPGPLISYGLWVSARRFGLDWDDYDYVARAAELETPMLVFHGDDDAKVPIATSRDLARRRPDLVTLVELPGVRHVQAWNRDPELYQERIARFLATLTVAN